MFLFYIRKFTKASFLKKRNIFPPPLVESIYCYRPCKEPVLHLYGTGSTSSWNRFYNFKEPVLKLYGTGSKTLWNQFYNFMETVLQL